MAATACARKPRFVDCSITLDIMFPVPQRTAASSARTGLCLLLGHYRRIQWELLSRCMPDKQATFPTRGPGSRSRKRFEDFPSQLPRNAIRFEPQHNLRTPTLIIGLPLHRHLTRPSKALMSFRNGTSMDRRVAKLLATTPMSTFAPLPSTPILSVVAITSLSCARPGITTVALISSIIVMRLLG